MTIWFSRGANKDTLPTQFRNELRRIKMFSGIVVSTSVASLGHDLESNRIISAKSY